MMYLLKGYADFDDLSIDQQLAVIAWELPYYYNQYNVGEVEPLTNLKETLRKHLYKVKKIKKESLRTEKLTWYYDIERIEKDNTTMIATK